MPDVTGAPSAGFTAVDSCAVRRRTQNPSIPREPKAPYLSRLRITDIFDWTVKLAITARLQAHGEGLI